MSAFFSSEAGMELIWKKGVDVKIAIAPRSVLIVSAVVFRSYTPEQLASLSTIVRSVLW